uniref:Poly(ADP-ribose) polymerase family member 10 n=1 Tax=Dicentrarchus labrax TaxID=13489 RepID=A0A8C4H1K1_DICLA
MPVEHPEERTVEVLALPAGVDEELLYLYFENKRRSGGGPLVSVEKKGDGAVLVFEEAEAAAQVLSKGHHIVHNVELSVRKPASKDRCRLLLQGINPNTSIEMIELYVENMMDVNDYTLYPSPGRDTILIHLSQPLSKDFQNLSAKISKRTLDGAKVTLEQIEQTDSILVENLHPGTTPDLLTLYFENKGGGNKEVKEVTMLSESTAKVSFVKYDSVGPVLDQPHKLEGADLVVKPYFDFLQPTQSLTSQYSGAGSQDMTERNSEHVSDVQMQTSPPMVASTNSQSSSLTAPEPVAASEAAEEAEKDEVMEAQSEDEDTLSSHIAIADPVKLALLQLSSFQIDTAKAHPNVTIQIKDNGVHIAEVSEQGGNIDVLTLKGMETEKQTAILEFLSKPIERETVLSMEPGMLKYIQIHCHQLLADMHQVSIFPLEAEDVCGLKIHGPAVACQMAEELLQGVVSSICTRTITVNAPGVARFFDDQECQSIMKEMETKFQVYISPKYVPWEPLPNQDIFETAWTIMSHNFQRVSLDDSGRELKSDSMQTDQNGAAGGGLLEEAKRIVSAIDERLEEGVSISDQLDDMDNLDLYTDEPTSLTYQDPDVIVVDASQPSAEENTTLNDEALGLSSNLEEEAQLSLAIQYSMESSHWSLEDEEEQLQKALELSKKMIQHEAPSSSTDKSPKVNLLKKGNNISLQDAIKSANTIQLFVFAGYSCDLIRVDIAFGKKVNQRQVEEKLEHRTVKNMSEYHRKCLEMIKRKHAVDIQIQGTIITVSGFKDFVTEALLDVKLLLDKISNSVSDQEILRVVQWVRHDPASSNTTPYSPDATVFIENVWRMKMKKIDILLDNQPHTINFEKMQEYNIASGKSVKISRKLVDLGELNEDVPGKGNLCFLHNETNWAQTDEM